MKKFLALLLAASMAFSLCACGSNSGVSMASDNPPASSDYSGTVNDPDTTTVTDEPNEPSSQSDTENSAGAETSGAIDDSSAEPSAPDPEPATTPSGLILMTTTDSNLRDPKIYSVDIETGESELIAEWDFRPRQGDIIYYSPGAGFSCGHREWFTSDYSKIAVSMADSQNGQSCAGWIDVNGDFFNVSEALGQLDRGDFDDPVAYLAVGFTDDGFFVYKQVSGSGANGESSYHYVPANNVNPAEIQDGIPFPGYDEDGLNLSKGVFSKVTVSDYIGGSRYLINTSDGVSQIFDTATGEKTGYVPGTSRFSWHGVLSPDGRQIAFMSQPKSGTEKDIYIMPLEGGDPVKVPTDNFQLSSQQGCETGHDYGSQITVLVDWR